MKWRGAMHFCFLVLNTKQRIRILEKRRKSFFGFLHFVDTVRFIEDGRCEVNKNMDSVL
jgi:hypothetical protein